MFCSNCGVKLIDGASFCTNCGTKIIYQEQDITKEMTQEEPPVEDVSGYEAPEQTAEEAFGYAEPEQTIEESLGFGADEQAAEEYEDYVFAGAASKEEYEAQQANAQQNQGQNANYGYETQQNVNYQPQYLPQKSKIAAGVLSIILGDIGVGYFYMGKIGLGLLSVFFCWTGIPAIVGLIQGIIWLCMSDEDFGRKYNCRVS